KQPTDTIFAYCDKKNFQVIDMFKYKIETVEDKENFKKSKCATTIKKTKQTSLFSFIKK
ncbi:hypothetical protein M153_23590002108, partial [Pseudoloma neurophilia]